MDALRDLPQRPDVIAEERGGDPDQTMTSEPEATTATIEEARFWRDTYAEIMEMEEQVMARVHALMARESPEVRREVEMSNVPVIAAQLDRFRHRHLFWASRVAELRRNPGPPTPRSARTRARS
jgi:hypothetical protein